MKTKNGFTLVEVLLALVVIALLVAMTLPIIIIQRQKSAARVMLLNGLTQSKNPVLVDKNLYYFKEMGLDGLKAVQTFAEEHTNLTLVASFSVNENHGRSHFTSDWTGVRLGTIPDELSLTTGYFAIFRPTPTPTE